MSTRQQELKQETTENGGEGGGGGQMSQRDQREGQRDNQGPQNFRGKGRFQGGLNRDQMKGRNINMNNDKERKFFNNKRFGPGKNNDGGGNMGGPRNIEDKIYERLNQLNGPTYEIAPIDNVEKKFSGRNRLYVGNLPADFTEDELNELFKPFGETSELFINKEKNFGFIRLDFHANAEKAKRELDGVTKKGRQIKVRFAPNNTALRVRNLTPYVTNELLHAAFAVFGEIERCLVTVDDRGKPTGEGIVEYVRKPAAQLALKHCTDGCFFLTASLRPVIVELYDQIDNIDGFPEKSLLKKAPEYRQAREVGPRFASKGSFEYEYGSRWKQLYELYKQKEASLKQELKMEEDKLEAQMEFAKFENETEMLREQLRAREMDRDRQKREWEERERLAQEQRMRNEEQMRRQQEELSRRMLHQEEDLRRRQQENNLFMQAHQLSNMLNQQEQDMQNYDSPNHVEYEGNDNTVVQEPQKFGNNYERSHRFEGGRGMGDRGGRGHWGNDMRRDEYPPKRRRY